ncbi:phospholipase A2 [Nocardia amikacinitolerans]|uniref:phospholipase A2 n=1 Tax=Nocardia amikacinitolerans TaxID=756689 RepID=UPI0020A28782|nr:phospholipase A2 [Nocardia amikacinitolerans]MCP2293292.1 phospholipase A2 [Nocardia amikacinitolerans]
MKLISVVIMAAAAVWAVLVAGPAHAHTTQTPATPSNDGPHPWAVHPSESSACSTPGISVSSVFLIYDFNHACKHHDGCYEGFPRNGKPTHWVSRKQCDDWFLGDMWHSCQSSWDQRSCLSWMATYYNGVRVGGGPGYRGPVNN